MAIPNHHLMPNDPAWKAAQAALVTILADLEQLRSQAIMAGAVLLRVDTPYDDELKAMEHTCRRLAAQVRDLDMTCFCLRGKRYKHRPMITTKED